MLAVIKDKINKLKIIYNEKRINYKILNYSTKLIIIYIKETKYKFKNKKAKKFKIIWNINIWNKN